MANVQLYRIQFLQDNPFGDFVTGDVLDVFFDTTLAVVPSSPFSSETTGITVELNGSPYAGTGLILDFNPSIVSIQNFSPQICNGTSLIVFGLYGLNPYATYYTAEDHFSCVVNPPTCDLIVVGVPIVVPSTDAVTADGSIQLIAHSSLNIQYNLGADFVYGEGQTESIFSALLPGQYRIYLRDEANCAVNILVEVIANNVYGEKFRLEYTDNNNVPTRLDILKRGHVGDPSEICGTGTPFELLLRGEGSQNKFEALMSSQGNLNLTSETDLQFIELYTNDPNLYRLKYYKDFGNMSPADPGFTPAVMDDLEDWVNIDTGEPAWSISPAPSVDFNSLGLSKTSDLIYTDYAFEAGRQYTFDYEFNCPSPNATFKIKIFDASMNELMNTDIVIASVTQTGQYVVVAPVGAAGIGIEVFSGPSCGSGTPGFCAKNLLEFSNVTAAIPPTASAPLGYELLWYGKILPQQYAEEYKAPPYYVSTVSTDGLAELKNFFLIQADGQKYYGTISLIKLVSYCLSFLKLDLDIRCACNLYALEMNQEDANDPFDQAYIDFETFYIAEKEPTLEFVLRHILEAFGARITQWENRWNIERVEEKVDEHDFRLFNKDGNYLSNGSFDPVINIEYPDDADEDEDMVLAMKDHNLEIKPGYGRLKALYHLGLKPNILKNGDFRLKSIYDPVLNTYYFNLNKDGWTLVNAGYIITEGYEFIDPNNIAYTISSGDDTLAGTIGGEAYLQSDTYAVKMGTNNQLKIVVRCKVNRVSIAFGTQVFTADVPYVKVRIQVRYGSLYLQSDGSWSATANILTFYTSEFNKYADYEIVANQPLTGTPVDGMDLDVRVFHAYAYHAQFFAKADLEAFETYDGVDQTIPTGYKTELRVAGGPFFGTMYYYELEETTDAASGFLIVEPTDYHVTNNPRKWVLKVKKLGSGVVTGANVFKMCVDKIVMNYLTDNNDPIDTIVRSVPGEASNPAILEKDLIIGSHSNLIVTEVSLGIDLGVFFPSGGLAITTTNTLSADLIYSGYLRDADGIGYENFARDGIAEADKLHGIILKSMAVQYKKSWRLLRGSIYPFKYFGLLNVARLVNDSNRIYMPIALTINDKKCLVSGEFLELTNVNDPGNSGSAFTKGFQQAAVT